MDEPRKLVIPNELMLGRVSEFLSEGRDVVIMTKGSSMMPFIRGERDSVVLLRRERLSVGDIVLAQIAPGHYVLHRINAMKDDLVRLKGDGNLDGTELCRASDVCGTVTAILKGSGRRVDCSARCFKRRSRLWVKAPRIVRRYCLGIYRRLKFL